MRWRCWLGLTAAGLLGPALLPTSAGASSLSEIKARGTLRVLVVSMSGPDVFFPLEPGPAPGFDRELLEGFTSLHRVRLEVVPVAGWETLVPSLLQGNGDLVAGRVTATESRKKLIDFTTGVFPTRPVVVTRKPHPPVTSVEQLREQRVGTVRGTSLAETVAAAGVPPSRVDDTIGVSEGTLPLVALPQALRKGRVTAVVMGVESAFVVQNQDPQLQLGLFLGSPAVLAYGVRKQDADLLAALNDYIENTRRTPTWNRLVVKYFGEEALEILKTAREE